LVKPNASWFQSLTGEKSGYRVKISGVVRGKILNWQHFNTYDGHRKTISSRGDHQ